MSLKIIFEYIIGSIFILEIVLLPIALVLTIFAKDYNRLELLNRFIQLDILLFFCTVIVYLIIFIKADNND